MWHARGISAEPGDTARDVERFDMGRRIREVEKGPDGAWWLHEDGSGPDCRSGL
jgi:hypothetical protein